MKLLVVICAVLIICSPKVNSAKTCLSLDNLIANKNPAVFVSCTRNASCNTVNCNIVQAFQINTATLTLLPCYTPPALNIVIESSTFPIEGNFTFSESATGPITAGVTNLAQLSWNLDYLATNATFADFQLNITFQGTESVLFANTDIILDLSVCGAATSVTNTAATSVMNTAATSVMNTAATSVMNTAATSVKNTFAGMMLTLLLALVSFTSM